MKTLNVLFKIVLVGTFILNCLNVNGSESNYPFTNNNVQQALEQARREGKLVFLDFSAKWCTPCRYMEETTFKDQKVLSKLKDRYVAVKVDIDKGNGALIKKQFEVKYLPTMLIVDANGLTLKKIEETVSAEDLYETLQTYENTSTGHSSVRKNIQTQSTNDTFNISREEYLKYSRMEDNRSNYRLQLGVFDDFNGASKKSAELKELFVEPIVILQDSKSGKNTYKVLMGNFASLSEAESFSKILRNDFKLESIIK